MKVFEFFSGRPEFASKLDICQYVVCSKNFNRRIESPEETDALLFFDTKNQHTWLVASKQRLYCILDDIRKDKPHINWSIDKRDIVKDGEIIINIKARPHSEFSGLLDVGDKHTDWLYTKRLFTESTIVEEVRKFIHNMMITKEIEASPVPDEFYDTEDRERELEPELGND